ncbi:MAG TPA: hypothetical protein VEZ24_08375 [Microvirga sp.]|nr:hypothetical protein [Microvirga sp.]
MQDLYPKKFATAALVGILLGGSTLVSSASAVAADLGPYVTDEESILERPSVRRRIVVEENYSAPSIEHRVVERRVVERRIVEDYEGPALVPQQYLPTVPVQESEGYEGPALVPPQYVPVVPVQQVRPPLVQRQRFAHMPTPAEECRVIVTKRRDAFGAVVVRRTQTCD